MTYCYIIRVLFLNSHDTQVRNKFENLTPIEKVNHHMLDGFDILTINLFSVSVHSCQLSF